MARVSRRGLTIIYTGDGKGKTTAALGAVFRALGHGWKVLVVQFFKGDWPVVFGDAEFAKRLTPQLEFLQLGKGFVKYMGDTKPLQEHVNAAQEALALATERIRSGHYDLVVLDEALYALGYKDVTLLRLEDLLGLIRTKPSHVHLILTGRSCPKALIDAADLVTEMREVKHPYRQGVPAQVGIDY